MEMIDVIDENVIDIVSRVVASKKNMLRRGVVVYVFNEQNQLFIHRRPKTKKHFPNKWDLTIAGGIESGEAPISAAKREVKEELGTNVDPVFFEFKNYGDKIFEK